MVLFISAPKLLNETEMRNIELMKQWKKYLAVAGAAALVLVLAFSIKNNGNKEETEIVKNSTPVQENLQTETEVLDETETNSILSAEENSSQDDNTEKQEQSVSEEEIKSEIDNLINTYYEALGDMDKNSQDAKEQTGKTNTADSQASKEANEKSTSEEKQTTDDKSDQKQSKDKEPDNNDIIEKYQDIKTYIKPGLDKDSYVVFTTYNIKLYNIDTLDPGMSSLVIDRDESGALSINQDQDNKELKSYINKLSKEKDIKKVIDDVNSKLTKAIKKDTSLQGFMDYLK